MKIKISIITWIAFAFHLLVFSSVAFIGIENNGFHWIFVAIALLPPVYFFIENIQEDNENK